MTVHRLSGAPAMAVRTGNNAARLSFCDGKLPLLGYSDEQHSTNDFSMVSCPANPQMEPTRSIVCEIMSTRRPAHLARWADKIDDAT